VEFIPDTETTFMATGTAPTLDPNIKADTEEKQSSESKPATLGQRFKSLLHKIFEGREEHLGWRQ
jgi:hypothetical protein